jgi:uncharacterized phiE125 gp8 family phage protein
VNYERWTKYALVTAPAVEPLTFADMQAQCRIDSDDEESIVESYIQAARVKVEDVTGRKLITQTWDVYYDAFHDPLLLPFGPLGTITSVKYQDGNNVQQTLASTIYEAAERNGRPIVRLKYNQTFPTTIGHADDVVIRVSFGYGTAGSSVPAPLLQVLRWYAGCLFAERTPDTGIQGVGGRESPFSLGNMLLDYTLTEF